MSLGCIQTRLQRRKTENRNLRTESFCPTNSSKGQTERASGSDLYEEKYGSTTARQLCKPGKDTDAFQIFIADYFAAGKFLMSQNKFLHCSQARTTANLLSAKEYCLCGRTIVQTSYYIQSGNQRNSHRHFSPLHRTCYESLTIPSNTPRLGKPHKTSKLAKPLHRKQATHEDYGPLLPNLRICNLSTRVLFGIVPLINVNILKCTPFLIATCAEHFRQKTRPYCSFCRQSFLNAESTKRKIAKHTSQLSCLS